MKIAIVLISLLLLLFVAVEFPTFQELALNATTAGNFTGGPALIINNLPLIFLTITIVLFVMTIVMFGESKDG